MPQKTIPLFGPITVRGVNAETNIAKDQRLINGVVTLAQDHVGGSNIPFVEKRTGWALNSTPSAGNAGEGISYFHGNAGISEIFVGFGETNTEIFSKAGTSYGSITGRMLSFSNSIIINNTEHLFIRSVDDTGWYLAYDVYASADKTFTGDTHTNTTIDNIAGSDALHVGQSLSGTGIQANTRIQSIDSATSITTTLATTATNAGVTITRGDLSKIIDADFIASATGNPGNFVEMDGWVFTCTPNGRIYNSDINSADSWAADNYIPSNISGDRPVALAVTKGMLACFGTNSIEFFQNAGNPSGSPLAGIKQGFKNIGLNNIAAITWLKDDIYFCTSTQWGVLEIYKLNGFDLEKISTPQVENILGSSTNAVFISSYLYGGNAFIQAVKWNNVSPFSHARTLVYNATSKTWVEETGNIATFISGLTFGSINSIYGVTRGNTGGKIYKKLATSAGYGLDDADAYTLTIQTEPKVLNGGKGFKIPYIDLLADTQSAGETTLEISRDDYGTWQVLGVFNLTKTRKRITRCGYCRSSAAFRLTDSRTAAWRGQALVVGVEPCET